MNDGEKRLELEEAAEWYFRRDAGSLTPEDEVAFERWLAVPANRAAFDTIGATWDSLGQVPRSVAAAGQGPVVRPAFVRRAMSIAAAIAVIFAIGYGLDLPMRFQADLYAATGETKTMALDDGSRVVLNTASAIAIDYSHDVRRIRLLRGEAIFTVAKDASRPFLVDAGGGQARALGTAFAVREEGGGATVTVIESHVAVSYPAGVTPAVELSPDEAVHFSTAGLGVVQAVNADTETAWRRGKLIFVNRRLGSVIAELNRYYPGRIQITNGSIGNHLVSGVFDTGEPLRALDAIEGSLGLRSTRLTDYLILLHR